jgi:hypothetical protein
LPAEQVMEIAMPGQQQPLGGGTNDRPLNDTVAETGPGVPDDAIGPEQRTVPEQMDLASGEEAERIARKLQAEVDERWRRGGSASN